MSIYQENAVNPNTVIDRSPYYFKVQIVNADGRSQEVQIGAIETLVLQDNIDNIEHTGYLVLNNYLDSLERVADINQQNKSASNLTGDYFNETKSSDRGFILKGDSRDFVYIDIIPKLEDSPFKNDFDNAKQSNVFRIRLSMAIYNTEEILGDMPGKKFKKLYLRGLHSDILEYKNSYFNTASLLETNELIQDLSNQDRSVFTGDAIKSFLSTFFKDANLSIKFSNNFESGSTKIFFSSPVNYKGIDCLNYLMSRHVSSKDNNYDRCILECDRYTSEFSLISLSDYFKNAVKQSSFTSENSGDLYLETFKLGNYSDSYNTYNIKKVSARVPSESLFFKSFGTINNFSYDPMPGILTQKHIASQIVHSHDGDSKTFNIEFSNNSIQKVMEAYENNYVKPFKGVSQTSPYKNFVPGSLRTSQKNINNIFSIFSDNPEQRLNMGRNEALFDTIFLNNIVYFKVPGSTHRQAGTFIGIDRDGGTSDSDFDTKILGVYFVIEVKHIFEKNEYINELRCVKTYNSSNVFLQENSI